MSVMQKKSVLKCACCDSFVCGWWSCRDYEYTDTATNPVTSEEYTYLTAVKLAGSRDWSNPLYGGFGNFSQPRTFCHRLAIWYNRELIGTNNSDMDFDGADSPDYIFNMYTGHFGPKYAAADGTKTPITTKPNYYACLDVGGADSVTPWVVPTLTQAVDILYGNLGVQGRCPWFYVTGTPVYSQLTIGQFYDVVMPVRYFKRAIDVDDSGPTPVLVYQAEADGYAMIGAVGVEVH